MGGKVDYHIHTWFSDGAASPASIVEQAKKHGYEKIAITDHDGTDGVKEALEAGKKAGLEVIPGIELATETRDGVGLHILGYYIDIQNKLLKETLDDLKSKRETRNKRLLRLLADMGYPLSGEDLQMRPEQNFIGKPVIARALVKKGYISKPKDAFKKGVLLESPQAKQIKKEKLETGQAIDIIRKAGGKAVLAHPIQIREFGDPGSEAFYQKVEDLVCMLKEEGLAGLECYHKDHNQQQAERFVQIAQGCGLWITCGSDFHDEKYE